MSTSSTARSIIATVLGLAVAASASCAPPAPRTARGDPIERSDLVLGTVCTLRLLDGGSEAALDAAFARLREIEDRMSANKAGTTVAAVNAAAGSGPVKVPADVLFVLGKALYYWTLSGGAFDPTIGPVVKLWNIGMDGERIPSVSELQAALPLVGAGSVRIDGAASTVYLPRAGMLLDLGAIAKGYAADEVGRILLERGVKAAVIDLGGNIMVLGKKADGTPWRVGVQDPSDDRGSYIGIAELPGGTTVVTSGIYERYFVGEDGVHYHHILDPATGYPVRNGLVSVTVIAESSIDADGLSTTLFALGLERGMALAESLPGVEAIFIDAENRVYASEGAGSIFRLSDGAYTMATLP